MKPLRSAFMSGDRSVRVDSFSPDSPGPHPAVVVIHGASGLPPGNLYMQEIAGIFASEGMATFVIHYFDRTGHDYATDEDMRKHFFSWMEALQDAVAFISQQPKVDSGRIGVFGFSLGGYLALAIAAQNPVIKAVVELAGGVDDTYVQHITRLPPTLILHGELDQRVPVDRAHTLRSMIERLGSRYEISLYPNDTHHLGYNSTLDAVAKSVAFLRRELGMRDLPGERSS